MGQRFLGFLLLFIMMVAAFTLQGCTSVQAIQYEGKEMDINTVEEILADKLEVENPTMDLEVQIYEESDSD